MDNMSKTPQQVEQQEVEDHYYSEEEDEEFYVVLKDFNGEEEDDLTIVKGEVLEFLEEDENGWWIMENERGDEGLVPSNYLEPYKYDEHSTVTNDDNNNQALDVSKNNETLAKNTAKKSDIKASKWSKIRKEVAPTVDITDVLSAFGAFPVGFVEPTLGTNLLHSDDFSLRHAVLPKLSESGVEFKDVFWGKTKNTIRPITTKILLELSLIRCKNIPLLPTGVEVISRNLRLALHDGTKVVENILTLKITNISANEKEWTIQGKDKNSVSEITVRSDIRDPKLGILLEFSFTYVKSPPKKVLRFSDGSVARYTETLDEEAEQKERAKLRKNGNYSEISCGWAWMPLCDLNGAPRAPRQYELEIKRGKPFQDLQQQAGLENQGKLRQLISTNRKPVLILKTHFPSQNKLEYLNNLPKNIVIYSSYCEAVSLYRRIFARDMCSTKSRIKRPATDPVLSVFPQVIDLPYAMEAISNALLDRIKKMTKTQRQDQALIEKYFTEIVVSVSCMYDIQLIKPKHQTEILDISAELKNEQENWTIERPDVAVGYTVYGSNKILQELLSPHKEYTPFDAEELSFNL